MEVRFKQRRVPPSRSPVRRICVPVSGLLPAIPCASLRAPNSSLNSRKFPPFQDQANEDSLQGSGFFQIRAQESLHFSTASDFLLQLEFRVHRSVLCHRLGEPSQPVAASSGVQFPPRASCSGHSFHVCGKIIPARISAQHGVHTRRGDGETCPDGFGDAQGTSICVVYTPQWPQANLAAVAWRLSVFVSATRRAPAVGASRLERPPLPYPG